MLNPFYLYVNVPRKLLTSGILFTDGKPLSAITLKSLYFLVYSINNTEKYETPLTVSLTDLCLLFGHVRNRQCNFSHHIHRIISHLNSIVEYPVRICRAREKTKQNMKILDSIYTNIPNDTLTVVFSQDFLHYLSLGTGSYSTTVDLKYLFRLHSFPATVLYLFGIGCAEQYECMMSIETLSQLLTGSSNHPYKRLKNDMLFPALKLIQARTDINICFDEKKSGNKIQYLSFHSKKSPAEDEILCYCKFEGITPEKYTPQEYNNTWLDMYDYDLVKQEYQLSDTL